MGSVRPKCPIHVEVVAGTVHWWHYAIEQAKRGAKQTLCADCGYWFWPAELGRRPRPGETRS